ncbi:hypothetical protein KR222_002361, partial [Zaprionus bogoriensis]
MNSNKELKSTTKGQKKIQKTNKKQRQQLDEHQQQPANVNKNGVSKSSPHGKTKQDDPKNNRINNNNNSNIINNNNNNNYNNNNNNNYSITQSTKGESSTDSTTSSTTPSFTQKFNEQYEAERLAQQMISQPTPIELLPKMERTHSFRGKLSRIFNHLTGSKENLARSDEKKDESGKTPFTFTRSRSMIMLRRPNRRSFIEPQLEQLSEETEKSGDLMSPTSPRKTSLADSSLAEFRSPVLRRRADTANSIKTPAQRLAAQPTTSTPLEQSEAASPVSRKPSLVSLTPSELSFNPQLNFQKKRSNTLIASFKSTFGGLTGKSTVSGSSVASNDKKKDKMNPKWSASLQSLQAIDNMVSYANMSFIDYDKFNGYEKQLERQQSLMSLGEQPALAKHNLSFPTSSAIAANATATDSLDSSALPAESSASRSTTSCSLQSPRTVVLRRKTSSSSLLARQISASSRNSSHMYTMDSNYEHNFDKAHNLYRDSLDSRTLELLNQRSRNSYIQDQTMLLDALNLEGGSVNPHCDHCAHRVIKASSFKQRQDVVDGRGQPKRQV